MPELFCPQGTRAAAARVALIGALVGLARATVNEPKTDDTDRVLREGLLMAARPAAGEAELDRMKAIVQAEKHCVAPNCATCAMPCGNTDDYDMARLWAAPAEVRALKLRVLNSVVLLAAAPHSEQTQKVIDEGLFALAEDWGSQLLTPVALRAEALCGAQTDWVKTLQMEKD